MCIYIYISISRTKNKKPEQLASWIDAAAKLFAAEDIEMCEEVRCTESLSKRNFTLGLLE
jgi:hypothetical protein